MKELILGTTRVHQIQKKVVEIITQKVQTMTSKK
jgi:hypothetical protein